MSRLIYFNFRFKFCYKYITSFFCCSQRSTSFYALLIVKSNQLQVTTNIKLIYEYKMSAEECKEEQIGEIEALESIYPDELTGEL